MSRPLDKTEQLLNAIQPEFSSLEEFAAFLGDSPWTWRKKLRHVDENPSLNAKSIAAIASKFGSLKFFEIVGILIGKEFQYEIQISSQNPLTLVIFYKYDEGDETKNTGDSNHD